MLIGRRFVATIKATVPAAGIAGGTRSPSRMAAESTAIYSRQSARRLTEDKFSSDRGLRLQQSHRDQTGRT